MNVFGYSVATILAVIISCIWKGYVLCKLWSWFMVTTFTLPVISIPAAMGIALVVQLTVIYEYRTDESMKDEPYGYVLGAALFKRVMAPVFVLLSGYIITLFM